MGKGLRGDRGERISIGKGGKRSLGGKGRSQGEKALEGKGGKDLNRERGENILGRKRGKI